MVRLRFSSAHFACDESSASLPHADVLDCGFQVKIFKFSMVEIISESSDGCWFGTLDGRSGWIEIAVHVRESQVFV